MSARSDRRRSEAVAKRVQRRGKTVAPAGGTTILGGGGGADDAREQKERPHASAVPELLSEILKSDNVRALACNKHRPTSTLKTKITLYPQP